VTNASEIRRLVEEKTPGLAYTLERHRGWGKLVSESGTAQAGLSGLIPEQESRLFDKLQLAAEREYREGGRDEILGDPRDLREPHTIVLFATQAKRLDVTVGDVITIQTETMNGRSNTADVRVVAVARDLGLLSSFAVFTSKQQVLELYQLDADTTGAVWVYLDDIGRAEEVMGILREALAAAGHRVMEHEANPFFFKMEAVSGEDWTGQKLDVTIWSDEVSFLQWILVAFNALTVFMVLVLVVIISIGIMNAWWQSVRERTREIGTMRAIGLGREATLALFQIEALVLGVAGSTVGATLAAGIALGVDALALPITNQAVRAILLSETLHLVVPPAALWGSVLVLGVFSCLGAAIPSWRAGYLLTPVRALQHAE
jgi:putative ABC transport system permease protein